MTLTRRILTLVLALCMALPMTQALAVDFEDARVLERYWQQAGRNYTPVTAQQQALVSTLDGTIRRSTPTERAAALEGLKAVTEDDLNNLATAVNAPVRLVTLAYYVSLAACAQASYEQLPSTDEAVLKAQQAVALLVSDQDGLRDSIERERNNLRRSLTQADISSYAALLGLPEAFVSRIAFSDDWNEDESVENYLERLGYDD